MTGLEFTRQLTETHIVQRRYQNHPIVRSWTRLKRGMAGESVANRLADIQQLYYVGIESGIRFNCNQDSVAYGSPFEKLNSSQV